MPNYYDAMPVDWIDAGESTRVDVDGFPIAIANVDGVFYAFQNLCPHQGTSLGGRPVDLDCQIECPQHSSRYDIRTGECVRPSSDGFAQGLRTFATRIIDDVVQVEL